MKQLDLFPCTAHLIRINSDENMERYHSLLLIPDLFGGCALVRSWERIGRSSTTRIELYPDEGVAIAALQDWQYRKIGCGYISS